MITTRKELRDALTECKKAYDVPVGFSLKEWLYDLLFPNYYYHFMRNLRHLEYCQNRGGGRLFLVRLWYRWRCWRLRFKTGIELSPNCAGIGLHISHGKCVISVSARLGHHCKILSDVTIGGQGRYDVAGAPVIGNRVFISSGAKINGPIRIADDVVIGANAVVVKDIREPGTTWAGVPARKIGDEGSRHYLRTCFFMHGSR